MDLSDFPPSDLESDITSTSSSPSSPSSPPPISSSPSLSCSSSPRRHHERQMMKRLRHQLLALKSVLPADAATHSPSSVILGALRYKKALKREIRTLQMLLPYARQVKVIKKGTGVQIKVSCKKKAGLLIALMEVLESTGLAFSDMRVSCEDGIAIKALSKQQVV